MLRGWGLQRQDRLAGDFFGQAVFADGHPADARQVEARFRAAEAHAV